MVSQRRRSGRRALSLWMNGEMVGTWSKTTSDVDVLSYEESWINSPKARPLSLTLPFLPGNGDHRGAHVEAWFENLLPDSREILARVARRFGVTNNTRSLLAEIGRDCVGAVQILPADEVPVDLGKLELEPLTSADVARTLRGVTGAAPMNLEGRSDDEFRISVAGAQEKTALLRLNGSWYRPRGITPTTHIMKLPLGLVGNMRFDLEHSIANEWLCLHLLDALGFDVAPTEMATFSDEISTERVHVVERFDRQWRSDMNGITRLPQEDLCQATGTKPSLKYESEGGPGISKIIQLLRAGIAPEDDVRAFVLAQLAFWLLAAIDGHAKNYSLFLRRDGYTLTPLYDVLSAWPIIGHGANKLPIQKAKLAMAIRCKNRHYEIAKIATRHWKCLAEQAQVPFAEMEHLVQSVPAAIDTVQALLPTDFPESIWEAITTGLQKNAERFTLGIDAQP